MKKFEIFLEKLKKENEPLIQIIQEGYGKIFIGDHKDRIPGGLADRKNPNDFDKEQLKKGMRVELEHTTDIVVAMEIAMDHLAENPEYYDYHAEMEQKMERASGK